MISDRPLILIADDEEDNVILLEKRLKASGFDTVSARNGDEALEKTFSYMPDLLLLDIMMPKKDGYEVLEILRKNEKTKDVPVILLTAKAETPDKIKGLQLGAEDYVTKPFDFKELLARIKAHLEIKRGYEEKIKVEKLVALSTMMMGVAHEVRNPIVVIGGFAKKLLSMTEENDPRYKYILAIEKEVIRLENMIKDIYEFKTIEINKREFLSINDCIKEIVQKISPTLTDKNIKLNLNLSAHTTGILMDKANFQKAIQNIVNNAIEAMQNGGVLTIITEEREKTFLIKIIDTGIGIKEEDLKYIFDPFFTSKMEGTGLGLTLAMKIIEKHNGTITVKSAKDVGTTVTVAIKID